MSQSDYDKWVARVDEAPGDDNPLNVPFHVVLREGAIVADFVERRWEPTPHLPGLSRAKNRLSKSTANELRSLIKAIQEAQSRLILIIDPVLADKGERARFVCDELEWAIEYTLDDDVHEAADDQLAQLKAFHSQDGERSVQLAQALRDYAHLAADLKDRITEVDAEFDASLIDEAVKLANELSSQAPSPVVGGSDEARAATRVRNRLLHLLTQRIALVRRTAAYVFRGQPTVVREVTSSYERRRRAEQRRKKKQEQPAPPPAPRKEPVPA